MAIMMSLFIVPNTQEYSWFSLLSLLISVVTGVTMTQYSSTQRSIANPYAYSYRLSNFSRRSSPHNFGTNEGQEAITRLCLFKAVKSRGTVSKLITIVRFTSAGNSAHVRGSLKPTAASAEIACEGRHIKIEVAPSGIIRTAQTTDNVNRTDFHCSNRRLRNR
ncbi:hypothetical protein AB1N83_001763 [Pleurotus pulmonarius]